MVMRLHLYDTVAVRLLPFTVAIRPRPALGWVWLRHDTPVLCVVCVLCYVVLCCAAVVRALLLCAVLYFHSCAPVSCCVCCRIGNPVCCSIMAS